MSLRGATRVRYWHRLLVDGFLGARTGDCKRPAAALYSGEARYRAQVTCGVRAAVALRAIVRKVLTGGLLASGILRPIQP